MFPRQTLPRAAKETCQRLCESRNATTRSSKRKFQNPESRLEPDKPLRRVKRIKVVQTSKDQAPTAIRKELDIYSDDDNNNANDIIIDGNYHHDASDVCHHHHHHHHVDSLRGNNWFQSQDYNNTHNDNHKANQAEICNFCNYDPIGQEMHRQRPCDWLQLRGQYILECQNCADHRYETGDDCHSCFIRKKKAWRIYATKHPLEYPVDSACKNCKDAGRRHTCDADPFLGLKCTSCLTAKPEIGEKAKHDRLEENGQRLESNTDPYDCNRCVVGGREMAPKPNLRQGYQKWFRHQCDICKNKGTKKTRPGCSWLLSRANWSDPCSRCKNHNLLCMESGWPLVEQPGPIEAPTSWSTLHSLQSGWAECRAGSPYRKGCIACSEDKNHHCRALAKEIEYSCAMCWEMGIVCWDAGQPGRSFPVYDFSRVGMGSLCIFTRCKRCKDKGLNCDRQRPCDSCNKEGLTIYDHDGQLDSTCCDDPKDGYNCFGRFQHPPGPIYYLALGYGAQGVDSVKDGSRMEHWIGPPFPLYAIDKRPPTAKEKQATSREKKENQERLKLEIRKALARKDQEAVTALVRKDKKRRTPHASKKVNKMTIASIAQDMRRALLPPGPPPLGTDLAPDIGLDAGWTHVAAANTSIFTNPTTPRVQDKRIDQLSVTDLASMITAKWPKTHEIYPPNKHPDYEEVVEEAKQRVQELESDAVTGTAWRRVRRSRRVIGKDSDKEMCVEAKREGELYRHAKGNADCYKQHVKSEGTNANNHMSLYGEESPSSTIAASPSAPQGTRSGPVEPQSGNHFNDNQMAFDPQQGYVTAIAPTAPPRWSQVRPQELSPFATSSSTERIVNHNQGRPVSHPAQAYHRPAPETVPNPYLKPFFETSTVYLPNIQNHTAVLSPNQAIDPRLLVRSHQHQASPMMNPPVDYHGNILPSTHQDLAAATSMAMSAYGGTGINMSFDFQVQRSSSVVRSDKSSPYSIRGADAEDANLQNAYLAQ